MPPKRSRSSTSSSIPKMIPTLNQNGNFLTLLINSNSIITLVLFFRDFLQILGIWQHFLDFLARYPIEGAFTVAHRGTRALFTAVWSKQEIEQVLIHFVLHEAAVRGNGWSSVRSKLFAIRHHRRSTRACWSPRRDSPQPGNLSVTTP